MYNISWQVVPFPYNANKKRIFVTIKSHPSEVKFIIVVISCTSNCGLSYDTEPEIEILYATPVFAISVNYNDVYNSTPVSGLKQDAKLFNVPFSQTP